MFQVFWIDLKLWIIKNGSIPYQVNDGLSQTPRKTVADRFDRFGWPYNNFVFNGSLILKSLVNFWRQEFLERLIVNYSLQQAEELSLLDESLSFPWSKQ